MSGGGAGAGGGDEGKMSDPDGEDATSDINYTWIRAVLLPGSQ
jgi:hypothetical protein